MPFNIIAILLTFIVGCSIFYLHNLKCVDAVVATCEMEGNIEYWQCVKCNAYYMDRQGKQQISKETTILPALGHKLMYISAVPARLKVKIGKSPKITLKIILYKEE